MTEKFMLTVIDNRMIPCTENASKLNKMRQLYETFLIVISGITVATDTTDSMSCPDCGAEMALRTNRTNGNKFWGCKKYPNCKGTRDENGLSKAEREEAKYKKEQTEQQGGFSFNRDKRSPSTEVSPPAETGWVNPFNK
jgi:hypothetical protein